MTKTNLGLVNFVISKLGCPYWYGCFGQAGSLSLLSAKIKQYPKYYTKSRIDRCKGQYGLEVFDCVGLIKSYLWRSDDGKIIYNASSDVSADGMKSKCKENGDISSLPEIPGILLFMKGHVGVYIGNGYAIEATVGNSEYKVKKSKVSTRGWQSWGKCPYITYINNEAEKPVNDNKKYLSCKGIYSGYSLVDALKRIGEKSDFASRRKLAKSNGISLYLGTASQNIKLLNLLKGGTLIK
jgi:hypothetical protein